MWRSSPPSSTRPFRRRGTRRLAIRNPLDTCTPRERGRLAVPRWRVAGRRAARCCRSSSDWCRTTRS
eukprot:2733261-Rhodomonas_salina.2